MLKKEDRYSKMASQEELGSLPRNLERVRLKAQETESMALSLFKLFETSLVHTVDSTGLPRRLSSSADEGKRKERHTKATLIQSFLGVLGEFVSDLKYSREVFDRQVEHGSLLQKEMASLTALRNEVDEKRIALKEEGGTEM